MHMRLLFVAVALGLSTTASASGRVAAPARRQIGGNKCVSSSEKLSVNMGPCGTVTMGLNGVCAASKEEVDDQIKLMMSDLMDAGDAATAPLLTADECKEGGLSFAENTCETVSFMAGETIQVKAGLDMCNVMCNVGKYNLARPTECMSDSDCPGGEDIEPCCQLLLDQAKTVCDFTDAQLANADDILSNMEARGYCNNNDDGDDERFQTTCWYGSAGRYSASMVFALATGILAMLMSSDN